MSLVLEPEEEAALFMYILDGCKAGGKELGVKSHQRPHNYSLWFREYNRSGCKVTIPAIIEKYGKVVNDKVTYRGHGVRSFVQPAKDADRMIAPRMADKKFFSVSRDIRSAFQFTGDICCLFEITLKNAKVLDLSTVSFARSKEGGIYPAVISKIVEQERAERNENLEYLLNWDREILVLGGGEFTPLGEPKKYKNGKIGEDGKMDAYSTTYTGKTMGGRRRRTYRRKRKTTSS
jgi:hypothetical protein